MTTSQVVLDLSMIFDDMQTQSPDITNMFGLSAVLQPQDDYICIRD